jgi:hypothetical protein
MHHGAIRPAVIGSIFRLRRFTVPALCLDSGLARTQVYRILDELEKQQYLTKSPVQEENRKAERPLNIYTLVEDTALKAKLMDEFAPSLRLAEVLENPPEPDSLLRARAALDTIGDEFDALSNDPASLPPTRQSTLRVHDFEQKLNAVAQDLEIALFRMGLAQKEQLPAVVETEFQRLETARTQLAQIRAHLVEALEARLKSQEEASLTFREAVTYGLAALGKTAIESIAPARFESYYGAGQEPAWIANAFEIAKNSVDDLAPKGLFSNLYKDMIDSQRGKANPLEAKLVELFDWKYQNAPSRELKHLLAAVRADVSSAFRERPRGTSLGPYQSVLWTIVQFAIRYATDPDTAFWVAKSIENQFPATRMYASYNSLNFCFLAGNRRQAWSSWQSFAEGFFRRATRTVYPGTLIATVAADLLKRELLEKIEDVLGSSLACSIVAPQRVESILQDPYVIEPSVYNLISTSERVPLSGDMKDLIPKLYVYGPIENALRRPGVPALTLATGLVGLGLPAVDAWEIADRLSLGKALLVVNTSQDVQPTTLDRLNQFLGLVNPMRNRPSAALAPVDPSLTPECVRQGEPVVYAKNPEGTIRCAFALRIAQRYAYTASHE